MAAAQALGTDGNEGGCTNSWEETLDVAQLGEDRHHGESGGPTRVRQKWVGSQASLTHHQKSQGKHATTPYPQGPPPSPNWAWGSTLPSQNSKFVVSFPKSLSPIHS